MRRIRLLFFVAFTLVPCAAWPQGNPLGPEFRVNAFTTGAQYLPAVASGTGNFVVVWQSLNQDGSGTGIFGQRYASTGAALGPQFRVNTFTTGNQDLPAVAADATGNFVVVWASQLQDGAGRGVFGQRYASTGPPLGPEFRVNTYTTGNQYSPAVAASGVGNFVVVWTSDGQDGSYQGVFGQRYASSGASLGSEFRVNTATTSGQYNPAVASDTAGNFVVAWTNGQYGFPSDTFGRRYASSGAPLAPEFRVNTYTTGNQYLPAVASDGAGNFVVAWISDTQDGSYKGVFGQRYASSGASLGPEFPVNTFTTNSQAVPSVASDSSGNFVVAWDSFAQDGSYAGVFGQRYASTGAPLGPEFRVNTFTTDSQYFPVVASDAAGNFVIVWQSYGQDGSFSGVFGQRYGQIVPVELMHFRVE